MTSEAYTDRIAVLEEANRRLRRLLDGRGAPDELRHRLRSTLALLRAIIRASADTGRELADYVAHLEDRLDAIVRAQILADRYGEVELRTLLGDELLHYGASEGDRLLMSGPEVQLRPRAGQVLALAIHELAINAVEHGVLGAEKGQIAVAWRVADAGPDAGLLLLSWKESGHAIGDYPTRHGFGTDVLTRLLAYELGAVTRIAFGTNELRYDLRFPFSDQVGRVSSS